MHFITLTTLAFGLIGAAHANPASASSYDLGVPVANNVNLPDNLPVVELHSDPGAIPANRTLRLSSDPLEGVSALQVFPATLFLCQSFGCGNCITFDLSVIPLGVCLNADFNIFSGGIVQPSGEGLPFGVFVGPPGCRSFEQITFVNACFNFDGPFTQVFLQP